jgi:glutamate-1-semialdehyde 2,1-aminomutase
MAAGLAGLTQAFTPDAAVKLNARGDRLRDGINRVAARHGLPFQATGVGSIVGLHFQSGRIRCPADAEPHDPAAERRKSDLQRLFHLEMIERGFFLARRGFVSLALPVTDADCAAFTAAIDEFLSVQSGVVAAAAA